MPATTAPETRRHTHVFRTGNSLAVRLPAGWGKEGSSVALTRENGKIIIAPTVRTLADVVRGMEPLSAKFRRPKFGPFRPRLDVGE